MSTRTPIRVMLALAMVAVAMGLAAAPGCSTPPPTIRIPGTGTVAVTITGFTSDAGLALISLYIAADGFPDDQQRARYAVQRRIENGRVEVVFEDVPAGSFAVSAFHDADSDYELDSNLLGIPTEDWGVSRDAGGFLGPPSFEQARLELEDGQYLEITVPIG